LLTCIRIPKPKKTNRKKKKKKNKDLEREQNISNKPRYRLLAVVLANGNVTIWPPLYFNPSPVQMVIPHVAVGYLPRSGLDRTAVFQSHAVVRLGKFNSWPVAMWQKYQIPNTP
jgi:hypothetical protein